MYRGTCLIWMVQLHGPKERCVDNMQPLLFLSWFWHDLLASGWYHYTLTRDSITLQVRATPTYLSIGLSILSIHLANNNNQQNVLSGGKRCISRHVQAPWLSWCQVLLRNAGPSHRPSSSHHFPLQKDPSRVRFPIFLYVLFQSILTPSVFSSVSAFGGRSSEGSCGIILCLDPNRKPFLFLTDPLEYLLSLTPFPLADKTDNQSLTYYFMGRDTVK